MVEALFGGGSVAGGDPAHPLRRPVAPVRMATAMRNSCFTGL